MRKIGHFFLAKLSAAALLLALVGPVCAAEPLEGNYLLSQVDNAGGELQLQAGGRYEWFINAGTVNRKSAGRWLRAGGIIALTPDDPENPSGITFGVLTTPWDDDAERRYLRATFESDWANVLERCPLFTVKVPQFEGFAADDSRDWHAYARTAQLAVNAAHRKANAAIADWGKTKEGSPEWDASFKAASDALAAYNRADFYERDAREKAKLPAPSEREIVYPKKCAIPRPLPTYEPVPKERHPQIGIIIGNPEVNTAFVGVQFSVIFSDGSAIERISGPGGWTSLPVQPGKSVRAVRAEVDIDDPGRFTFPIALSGPGVLIIDINPEAFAVMKLEPTTLSIEQDGSLRSKQDGNGIYLRK